MKLLKNQFFFSIFITSFIYLLFEIKNLENILEFTTAHVFLTANSIIDSNFTKFVFPMPAGELWIENGRPYVSYPIFSFLLGVIFSPLQTITNIFSIAKLAGFLQITLFVFIIQGYLKNKEIVSTARIFWTFLFASILVSPGLYYHFNHIFYGDIFTLTFAILFFLVTKNLKSVSTSNFCLIFLCVFFGTLTEYYFWLVLFFYFLFEFFRCPFLFLKNKKIIFIPNTLFKVFFISLFASLLAIFINIYIYTDGVGGFDKLLSILYERAGARGSSVQMSYLIHELFSFYHWQQNRLVLYLYLITLFSAVYVFIFHRKLFIQIYDQLKSDEFFRFGLILLLASMIHTILFQNLFINHFFQIQKFHISLSILFFIIGLHTFKCFYNNLNIKPLFGFLFITPLCLILIFQSANQYETHFNFANDPYNNFSKKFGTHVSTYQENTICLNRNSFEQTLPENILGPLLFPQFHFYTSGKQFIWSEDQSCLILNLSDFDNNFVQ